MPLGYLTQQFTICGEVLAGDDVRGKAAAVLWAFADLVLPLSEPADVHDVLGGTVVTGARQVEARRHRVYRIDKEGASGFRVGPPISCGPGRENRVSRSVPARGRSAPLTRIPFPPEADLPLAGTDSLGRYDCRCSATTCWGYPH
jgi:hypothetical protein